MPTDKNKQVSFTMGGMLFEYDEEKNAINIKKHGISLKSAARVFFDYDRIEFFDEENSITEDRYDTIGNIGSTYIENEKFIIGEAVPHNNRVDDILFVVYTERIGKNIDGTEVEVTRLISARMATNFERGLYYGKYE